MLARADGGEGGREVSGASRGKVGGGEAVLNTSRGRGGRRGVGSNTYRQAARLAPVGLLL